MKRYNLSLILTFLLFGSLLFAQETNDFSSLKDVHIDEIEFRNQRVQDVLLTLARLGNISIIFDDTVQGTTTHFLSDVSLADAFSIVSNATGVKLKLVDGVWYASKIDISDGKTAGQIDLQVENISLESLVNALSRFSNTTILHDPLPSEPISLNIDSLPLERILNIALSRFPDYELTSNSDYFYIRYTPPQANADSRQLVQARSNNFILNPDGSFSIDTEGIRFSEAIKELFTLENVEFVLLKQSDSIIDRLSFSDKSFEEMLNLVLEVGEADFSVRNGIYYILEISRNDILKRFNATVQVPLEHIRAESIPALFPTGLISNSSYKIDSSTNSIILTGLNSDIAAVEEYIKIIDQPLNSKEYHRYDLLNASVEDVISLLPEQLKTSNPVIIPGQNAFLLLSNDAKADEIARFISMIDSDGLGIPVRLRYMKSEDLLKNLPPSVSEDNIISTADPTLVFFKGGSKIYQQFMQELEQIDRPIPQIRYQLLVIQFQEGGRERFDLGVSNKASDAAPGLDSVVGFIGNLLQLNFNIISTFGYLFAVELNWSITQSEARVMADTTLTGLSGEELEFRNTNTYRYRDSEIDPDTGEVKATGVTREIVSGLLLNISGWASGDGMVTMEIQTTVSKQGTDTSDSGNPPPTSERVINSNIRTQSGEPVVIGGLVNQEADSSTSKTPILGYIPLIGKLFTKTQQSLDNTELMIYIIPYIEYPFSDDTPTSELLEQLYAQHMEN